MRMTRPLLIAASVSLAALFAGATLAEAQTRHKRASAAPVLTVKKRSFLDSGRVVQIGTESHYLDSSTTQNRAPDYYSNRGRYGAETLPGRFDLPGGKPLFTF